MQRHSTFHSLFLRPTLIPLFFLATDLAGQNQPIVAVRATVPIVIDGRLDESVWQRPGMDQHIQRQPNEGQPASERTEVWFAYDDDALYVAARMFDPSPDSVTGGLARLRRRFPVRPFPNVSPVPRFDYRQTGPPRRRFRI